MKRIFALSATALILAGCATYDPNTGAPLNQNRNRGAIIGALGGAAAGVLAGGNDGRNAAIGAAVGAVAGAGVGRYMDQQEAQLRRQTAGTGIDVVRQGDQIELRMPSDVTFAVGQSAIQAQFYSALNDVSKTLVQYPSTAVDIVGHADSDGSDSMNQSLSERRAFAVRDYLASQGVQTVRMAASGRGESQPIAPNDTPANKAKNRRVQVVLTPITN